jgi:hypothetical protein
MDSRDPATKRRHPTVREQSRSLNVNAGMDSRDPVTKRRHPTVWEQPRSLNVNAGMDSRDSTTKRRHPTVRSFSLTGCARSKQQSNPGLFCAIPFRTAGTPRPSAGTLLSGEQPRSLNVNAGMNSRDPATKRRHPTVWSSRSPGALDPSNDRTLGFFCAISFRTVGTLRPSAGTLLSGRLAHRVRSIQATIEPWAFFCDPVSNGRDPTTKRRDPTVRSFSLTGCARFKQRSNPGLFLCDPVSNSRDPATKRRHPTVWGTTAFTERERRDGQ